MTGDARPPWRDTGNHAAAPAGEPRWLTAEEVAAMIGVTDRQIYLMGKRGELPAIYLGRSVRFPREAILQWIEDKEAEAQEKRVVHGFKITKRQRQQEKRS